LMGFGFCAAARPIPQPADDDPGRHQYEDCHVPT
jgi:hypothetical protein